MQNTDKAIFPDQGGSDAGQVAPVGVAEHKIRVPMGKQVLNYFDNIRKAVFTPKNILAPQKISLAGGSIGYTLSEDVQKIRGEAWDAGERSGLRQSKKLERYVEGEKAIDILERGKKYGYNNGYSAGQDAGAVEVEKRFGGFEEMENTAYNQENVVALIGKRFVVVNEWDDEFSLLIKRYGKKEVKDRLLKTVDKIIDGSASPLIEGPAETMEFIEKEVKENDSHK